MLDIGDAELATPTMDNDTLLMASSHLLGPSFDAISLVVYQTLYEHGII